MARSPFMINNEYQVYPALNQVHDRRSGSTTRLEPRLMAVLLYLSATLPASESIGGSGEKTDPDHPQKRILLYRELIPA